MFKYIMNVSLLCVKDGGRLRVRITSPGYKNNANCQFPRNIRVIGRKYNVKSHNIRLRQRGNTYYYYIYPNGIEIDKGPIENKIEQVFNTEDDKDCVICLDTTKDSVFNPCGHYVCCKTCASKVKKCPICRTECLSIIPFNVNS